MCEIKIFLHLSSEVDKQWIAPLRAQSRRKTLHISNIVVRVDLFHLFESCFTLTYSYSEIIFKFTDTVNTTTLT